MTPPAGQRQFSPERYLKAIITPRPQSDWWPIWDVPNNPWVRWEAGEIRRLLPEDQVLHFVIADAYSDKSGYAIQRNGQIVAEVVTSSGHL